MKTNSKKLRLNRESIRNLSATTLLGVFGGSGKSSVATCGTCDTMCGDAGGSKSPKLQ